MRFFSVVVLFLFSFMAFAEGAGFRSLSYERVDSSRNNRVVPVKIYYPESDEGKSWPMIIFSHGLGGTREGYAYLGEYWAKNGFISVHLQHAGSDDAVWKDVPHQPRR